MEPTKINPVHNAVLPPCSLTLVSGANGYIASHIIEQLLDFGYKVRGTARSTAKLDSLKSHWDKKHPGYFEAVEVADITKEGAFDVAMKGIDGVIHVASPVTFSTDYDQVVGTAVDGSLEILRAASKTPFVKRSVLTFSIVAVGMRSLTENDKKLGKDDYNDESIKVAKSISDDDKVAKGKAVYCASKTEAERAAWKFIKENEPSFEFNTALPGFLLGAIIDDVSQTGSSAGMMRKFFLSEADDLPLGFAQVEFVAVSDIALLHIGALLLPDIKNERLIGSPHACGWNGILSIFRKNLPNKKFRQDLEEDEPESIKKEKESRYEQENSRRVLSRLGKDEWVSIEGAVLENVASVA